MKMARVAAAFSFAHLIGLGKRAEDDEDKKSKRAADEEEEQQASRAEEGDEEEEEARADEQDGDADEDMQSEEEDEQDGDEKDKGKKARKAKSKGKRAEDEEGDEEEDADDKSARSAARRERARCAKIIAHGITTGRVRQAGVLAFDTNLTAKAAIATLKAGAEDQPMVKVEGAPVRKSIGERMVEANVQNVGADDDGQAPAGVTATAAAIIAAGEKARGQAAKK